MVNSRSIDGQEWVDNRVIVGGYIDQLWAECRSIFKTHIAHVGGISTTGDTHTLIIRLLIIIILQFILQLEEIRANERNLRARCRSLTNELAVLKRGLVFSFSQSW